MESLNLFKVGKSYGRRGETIYVCSYSHPTFQEYFAAFYLTNFIENDQISHLNNLTHEVYRFFLGLIGSELKYENNIVFHHFISIGHNLLATYYSEELFLIKCAHEIGRQSHFISYLKELGIISDTGSLHLDIYGNSHDCWYIGYILTQSSLRELYISYFFQSDFEMCIRFISEYLQSNRTFLPIVDVTQLSLHDKYFDVDSWPWFTTSETQILKNEVLKFISNFKNHLTHLWLKSFKFEYNEGISQLGEYLKSFEKLEHIGLIVNVSIIKDGLLEMNLQNLSYLNHLDLAIINADNDMTPIPDNLLEFNNFQQLKILSLCICWNNTLNNVNMTRLIGGLGNINKLKKLNIHLRLYDGFGSHGATELVKGIQKVPNVNELTLYFELGWKEGLGNITSKELFSALTILSPILQDLSLTIRFELIDMLDGNNHVIELAEGLKGLTELKSLSLSLTWHLSSNNTINKAALALANSLKHLNNLTVLKLCLFQNDSLHEIATAFMSLAQLQVLRLAWTTHEGLIGKTNVKQLLAELKHLKNLQKLDLSNNTISDEDIVPLVEALKSMNQLTYLDLSHNVIGDNGVQLLSGVFKLHLTNLHTLLLGHNAFTKLGAEALADKIVSLRNIKKVKLGSSFGSYTSQALAMMHTQRHVSNEHTKLIEKTRELHNQRPVTNGLIELISNMSELLIFVRSCVVILIGIVITAFFTIRLVRRNKEFSTLNCLALDNTSASMTWKLDRLENLQLDGTGTVIALLDTEIDRTCPAFRDQNIITRECLPSTPVSSVEHGTICAAVAIGKSYEVSSVVIPRGVAPGATLLNYRVADGGYCTIEAVLAALDDIKKLITQQQQLIDVVSISYDLHADDESLKKAISQKIQELTNLGVVIVAAVGNKGNHQPRASIPARFDNVIAVGSLDKYGDRSRFTPPVRVDAWAVGEEITNFVSPLLGNVSGTSYATPAIAGLVSLLIQCANKAGSPAKEKIHNVRLVQTILKTHMMTKSENGQKDILDPVWFFHRIIKEPSILTNIVSETLPEEPMEH